MEILGNNLGKVRCLDPKNCNLTAVKCNSIWEIMNNFGIEAARNAIIQEAKYVFSVYSISVDERHLALIADYMT